MTAMNTKKVISAKSVAEGETVYLTSCDAWSADVAYAEVLVENDFDWRLAFARRLREVSDANLTDAKENELGLAELIAA